MIGLDDSMI